MTRLIILLITFTIGSSSFAQSKKSIEISLLAGPTNTTMSQTLQVGHITTQIVYTDSAMG